MPSTGGDARLSLTVWIYDTTLGAVAGQRRLHRLEFGGALRLHEAMTLTWVPGAHQPSIRCFGSAPPGPDGRSVLGHVADGLVATGRLVPGSSALLVLAGDIDLDVVRPAAEHALARGDVILLHAVVHGARTSTIASELSRVMMADIRAEARTGR